MKFLQYVMLVSVIFVTTASAACAEGTVQALLADRKHMNEMQRQLWNLTLQDTARGFEWASSYYQVKRQQPPLYCEPPDLSLTGEQIFDMLDRASKRDPKIARLVWPVAMIAVFQHAFPCEQ